MEFNTMCRICLAKKYEMEDIFNIVDVIRTIAPIQLEKEDGLPSVICSDCLLQANQAYNFRLLCIQSDGTLRKQLTIKEEYDDETSIHSDNFREKLEEIVCEIKNEVNEINNDVIQENTKKSDKNVNRVLNKKLKRNKKRQIISNLLRNKIDDDVNTKRSDIIDGDNDDDDDQDQLLNNTSEDDKMKIKYCHICDIQFENINEFKEHRRKHMENLECRVCNKRFKTFKNCCIHMRTHKEGTYLCDTCGKTFTRSDLLNVHKKIHIGIKSFVCKVCNRPFLRQNELKCHMWTHTTEKTNLCNICGNKYKSKPQLQYHMKHKHMMAPDERPHVCHCGKTFKEKRLLHSHQRDVHNTVDRKYVCTVCNNDFKTARNLQSHEKIHKGEKPFVCVVCNYAFMFKSRLHRHMKNIHKRE